MVKLGVIQLTSKLDFNENIEKIDTFIKKAKKEDVNYIFLPECFYSISNGSIQTPYLIDGNNEHYKNIQSLAKKNNIYVLGGSAATVENGNIYNRSYNFAPNGDNLGHYDKINLFSCDITKDGKEKKIDESDIFSAGKKLKIIKTNDFKLGLSICFDIRFPSLYWSYANQGVNIISISSAFTVPSGKAHWHTLVRARAIETQCFIVASAQYGRHNERIQTFGHSLIIDPWGNVIEDAQEGEKFIWADIDLNQIESVRRSVKVF